MVRSSFVRGLALAAVLVGIPAAAYAAAGGSGEGVRCGGMDEAAFPMAKPAFLAKVDEKIAKVRSKAASRATEAKLPDATRKQMLAEVDAGATRVRALAEKVAADGSVTLAEAKQVKDLAKQIKHDIKAKYGLKGHGKRGDAA
jgi:hypothetical protein